MEQQLEATDKKAEIVETVERFDLPTSHAWSDLDVLATKVYVEQIEVDPESIVIGSGGNEFKGGLNIFLNLHYGPDNEDGFSNSASFWGTFEGHFVNGIPVIDNVSVDTSNFYT